MPISLSIALGLTFIYVLLKFNQTIYDELYLKVFKIDILGTLAICSLVLYCTMQINTILAIICSVLVFAVVTLGQYSVYYTKKKEEQIKNSDDSIYTDSDTANIQNTNTPVVSFNGKRGLIKGKINGNYYLGEINMGTEESPSMQEILLYNEDGFNNGDTYEITGIHGSNILAKKV